VREERLRALRAGVEVWRVSWEGEAEPAPLNHYKLSGWYGAFLVLEKDQEVASCKERGRDEWHQEV